MLMMITTGTIDMFYPKDNPGYYQMADQAKSVIVTWVTEDASFLSSSSSSALSYPPRHPHSSSFPSYTDYVDYTDTPMKRAL